jgi:hypothetical protein
VFQDFGFGDLGLKETDFLTEDCVVEIGREPRKIQVLTGIDGVRFEECRRSRIEIHDGGMTAKFIDKANLLKNKAASARPKAMIDLEALSQP